MVTLDWIELREDHAILSVARWTKEVRCYFEIEEKLYESAVTGQHIVLTNCGRDNGMPHPNKGENGMPYPKKEENGMPYPEKEKMGCHIQKRRQ